jgi:hypothetical protein
MIFQDTSLLMGSPLNALSTSFAQRNLTLLASSNDLTATNKPRFLLQFLSSRFTVRLPSHDSKNYGAATP